MTRFYFGLIALASFIFVYSTINSTPDELPATGAEDSESSAKMETGLVPSVHFFEALELTPKWNTRSKALEWIDSNWSDQMLPYFIEVRRFVGNALAAKDLADIFERHTGVDWRNFDQLNQYVWAREIENTPDYAVYKKLIHSNIDPKFERYFEPNRQFKIRLDEVTWGGVAQDGIPPLRKPKMLAAADADYLADSDVVFGIAINGDMRAYPKRILAWHEMFVDEVGGVSLAGVYCTLCGTVIAYDTNFMGTTHALGTSGFLYRSNKLMYDQATQSLWSTLEGIPVIGPLVGEGIELAQYALVTTTWGEWKKRHPNTQVLSLDTGHRRDYGEGVAYHTYFATDDRVFETPYQDSRLKNKDEVLTLRFGDNVKQPVVIYEGYLRENPIYENVLGSQPYVIFTDKSGANRIYERPNDLSFTKWDQNHSAKDSSGSSWKLTESALLGQDGRKLKRLPGHRAFWFGWHGAFPDTVLIR